VVRVSSDASSEGGRRLSARANKEAQTKKGLGAFESKAAIIVSVSLC
jgi:hypothetical protein